MSRYKDFLVEHYRQVNEHDRETNRRRDILFGSYASIIFGSLVLFRNLDYVAEVSLLAALVAIGITVAVTVTRFRGWHAEYINVAKAIHMVFMNDELTLWDAAMRLKKEKGGYRFFKAQGVEFMMFIMTLALLSLPLVMLYLTVGDALETMKAIGFWSYSLIITAIMIFTWATGVFAYRHYLIKREAGFPEDSWCILRAK